MDDNAIRNLAAAITLQAVRDYLSGSTKKKQEILADLRSPYMDLLTNGTAPIVAEHLEKHPEEIRKRLRSYDRRGGRKYE